MYVHNFHNFALQKQKQKQKQTKKAAAPMKDVSLSNFSRIGLDFLCNIHQLLQMGVECMFPRMVVICWMR